MSSYKERYLYVQNVHSRTESKLEHVTNANRNVHKRRQFLLIEERSMRTAHIVQIPSKFVRITQSSILDDGVVTADARMLDDDVALSSEDIVWLILILIIAQRGQSDISDNPPVFQDIQIVRTRRAWTRPYGCFVVGFDCCGFCGTEKNKELCE